MDYQRAETTLRAYMELVGQTEEPTESLSEEQQTEVPALRTPARHVNGVLTRLTPDHGQVTGKTLRDHMVALALVEQALSLIDLARQMQAAEDEFGYPVLPMRLLDPLVQDAATRHWRSGHYRIAVGEAATNVDRYTQRRLERFDISGTTLMEAAFSASPPQAGKPRLRCPGNQASEAVKSQQVGALNYAKACFMTMRNPAHHQKGDWNPLTAFHHLVSLSQVAWWVRNWDLVSYVATHTAQGEGH
jgi:Protein of unknown function (Hypoth_ymh)